MSELRMWLEITVYMIGMILWGFIVANIIVMVLGLDMKQTSDKDWGYAVIVVLLTIPVTFLSYICIPVWFFKAVKFSRRLRR